MLSRSDAPICVVTNNPAAESHSAAAGKSQSDLSGETLLVANRTLSVGSSARFRCEMLAEPIDGSFEFAWYLNNSENARKELPALISEAKKGSMQRQSFAPAKLTNSTETTTQTPKWNLAVSTLDFRPETLADFGQIYCVARNSIGPQKRACVYSIAPQTSSIDSLAGEFINFRNPKSYLHPLALSLGLNQHQR